MLRAACLSALLFVPLLSACPAAPPGADADAGGAADAGPGDAGAADAGAADAGAGDGGAPDAGAGDDAGPLDEADAGDGDAGDGDAGEACAFPPLQPPPDAGGETPSCDLEDTRGAGEYEGTWEGQVYGSFPLSGPFDLPASGEMEFVIYCGADKLLVDGELTGRAYQHPDAGPDQPGHPFSGRMFGELDPQSGSLLILVDPASLVVGPFTGTFKVAMSALRQDDNTFEEGAWCGVTVEPEGGAGEGTWRAEPSTVDLP